MIGRIQGTLLSKQAPDILVDVGGVGYEIQVPMTSLFQLPEAGSEVTLLTHFVVREDAQLLYGFVSEDDRRLFRELIKVSGVGPKLALAILSGMDAGQFAQCVADGSVAALVKLPGVGKKTAERLVVEMRDRLQDFALCEAAEVAVEPSNAGDIVADAEGALIALGYKPAQAAKMITQVKSAEIDSSEELIRRALQAAVS
ncbi:MAG: Holliday junction branch migration protein RuvA [Gammaproteobacteria bacterium]|nr:MAG: Holliday junction branch migration protein RuvA [Gammaproteobacteria bacterium]